MKLKRLDEEVLLEYPKRLKNQNKENERLKDQFLEIARNSDILQIDEVGNVTVCHIDENEDLVLKKYINNENDNVMYVCTDSKEDSDSIHKLLNFCKRNYQKGIFSLIRTLMKLMKQKIYIITPDKKLKQISFSDAFRKVTGENK